MKTIGLIGGMSWESSLEYYRIINEAMQERLRGLHSAKILMYSFDFQDIEQMMGGGRWDQVGAAMASTARMLEQGGADLLLLCTNTVHKVSAAIESSVGIPFLHIADATGREVTAQGMKKVGLLGTRFTMEEDFYRKRLMERYGLEVLIPDDEERGLLHDMIFQELCRGILLDASKSGLHQIIAGLVAQGAEGVILGCTEIPLLIKQQDVDVALFDTTRIHALQAVSDALSG